MNQHPRARTRFYWSLVINLYCLNFVGHYNDEKVSGNRSSDPDGRRQVQRTINARVIQRGYPGRDIQSRHNDNSTSLFKPLLYAEASNPGRTSISRRNVQIRSTLLCDGETFKSSHAGTLKVGRLLAQRR